MRHNFKSFDLLSLPFDNVQGKLERIYQHWSKILEIEEQILSDRELMTMLEDFYSVEGVQIKIRNNNDLLNLIVYIENESDPCILANIKVIHDD